MKTEPDQITMLWNALKAECCVRPEKALRCVIVEEAAFRRAIAPVLTLLAAPAAPTGQSEEEGA